MYKSVVFLTLLISLTTYSAENLEVERRREQQRSFNELIRNQNFDVKKDIASEEEENLVLNISSIEIEGNTIFQDFEINSFLKKYIGNSRDSYALIDELENKYIAKGYITTKVGLNIEKSDFDKGKISLFILEGKIDKVFYNDMENKIKTFITFPQRENSILNIKDLEQGIENLGNNSNMEIKVSDKDNYSNVYIKRNNRPISIGINYNDLGQYGTSRHRVKYFLNINNIVGLNESIYLSYQQKLQRQKKDRDTENFNVALTVPFKYWLFQYTYESSEYLRSIRALGKNFRATGRSENQSFGLRKVIYRNNQNKIDIGGKITLKDSKNYIDDVRLTTGSRKLSVLTVDASYIGKVFSGLLSTNIGVSFGLRRFSANKDSEEWYRDSYTPKAQFRKYNLDISYYKPIYNFYYKTNIGLQYSKDILYSQEKLSIGDDTTVRGFKDESSQGDKGFYIRNEVGYRGNQFLEPYIAYDYGRNFNNNISEDRVETLQGISVGIKGYFKGFEGNFIISKPIDKPRYFKNDGLVYYTSITYRF